MVLKASQRLRLFDRGRAAHTSKENFVFLVLSILLRGCTLKTSYRTQKVIIIMTRHQTKQLPVVITLDHNEDDRTLSSVLWLK